MCETCGCGNKEGYKIHDPDHSHNPHDDHNHTHDHDHPHTHDHLHEHEHSGSHSHEHSHDWDHSHHHGHSNKKVINLNVDILTANNIAAGMNRRFFEGRKVLSLNMVSSPGSGKTSLTAGWGNWIPRMVDWM